MEVADVDALALIGGGLLVEPVPVTRACAAHELFPSNFLPKSLGKFTSSRFKLASIAHVYGVLVSTGEVVPVAKLTLSSEF